MMICCTAMADSIIPASRVTRTTPPSLMTRMISSEYRITSHSTTWMARIAVHTDTCVATLSAFCTARMTDTIAPGPASNGMPSGTSATLTSLVCLGSSVLPVSRSSAMSRSNSPPAIISAGTETCR